MEYKYNIECRDEVGFLTTHYYKNKIQYLKALKKQIAYLKADEEIKILEKTLNDYKKKELI